MVQTWALLLNTIHVFTHSKVIDLVLDQSQKTQIPIKTPEYKFETSNYLGRPTCLQPSEVRVYHEESQS